MNRLMKYQCLPRQNKLTLSTLTIKLVEEFIPSLHYKYVFGNFKQTSFNRTYNPSIVPSYLQGRPRGTILHCINRKASANKYVDTDVADIDLQAGIYTVKKHTVNFSITDGNLSCTCKDWISHHLPCKHFFGVFKFKDEWNWNSLPKCYLDSAYLSIDHSAISAYVSQPELDNAVPTRSALGEHELKSLYCPRELTLESCLDRSQEMYQREDTNAQEDASAQLRQASNVAT